MVFADVVDFSMMDRVNAIGGSLLVLVTYIFGDHWVLFVALIALNVADWITGTIKAHIMKQESSSAGLIGIMKKLSYWIMIAISFGMSPILNEIGLAVGADLSMFSPILGWLILAMFLVNELRSNCENLAEIGVPIPTWLTSGLKVAAEKIEKHGEALFDGSLDVDAESDEKYRVSITKPIEEIREQDAVTLKIHTIHHDEDD